MTGMWKKFREVFVILGMSGLFAALIFFGIIKTMERNHGKMNAIQQAVIDRKILEEQEKDIPRMREDAESIASVRDRTEVLLSKDRIISLVERVESIGASLGVSVVSEASPEGSFLVLPKKSSKKSSPAKNEGVEESGEKSSESKEKEKEAELLMSLLPAERSVFVVFKVSGPYDRVLAFSEKLDTLPTLLDVLSIDIAPVSEEDEDSSLGGGVSPQVLSGSGSTNIFASGSEGAAPNAEASPVVSNSVRASFSTVLYLIP